MPRKMLSVIMKRRPCVVLREVVSMAMVTVLRRMVAMMTTLKIWLWGKVRHTASRDWKVGVVAVLVNLRCCSLRKKLCSYHCYASPFSQVGRRWGVIGDLNRAIIQFPSIGAVSFANHDYTNVWMCSKNPSYKANAPPKGEGGGITVIAR